MKNSLITNFFGQPSLFTSFDDTFNNLIDCSVDSYKYRTIVDENDKSSTIFAQAHGLSKEDISITVENSILKISGERKLDCGMECSINKEFNLGSGLDESKISANLENGILEIRISRKKSSQPKNIEINV